jgi:malonyl-CoA O-methyltransferase
MTEIIDRNKVKTSFHQHAAEYDLHAMVQKRVVARMLEQLGGLEVSPRRVLDIGSGTGKLLGNIQGVYPNAIIVGADLAYGMCRTARENLASSFRAHLVTADAELLPFSASVFDLVISTSTFQWLTGLEQVFTEVLRVLVPGGVFCFALFGERTLFELKNSYRQALKSESRHTDDRTHNFPSVSDVVSELTEGGFIYPSVWAEFELELHRDVPALLRSLKRIGAGNAAASHPPGLSGRRVMTAMMSAYGEEYGDMDSIPATYEVIYGVGRRKY